MAEDDPVNIRRREFESLREEVLSVKRALDTDTYVVNNYVDNDISQTRLNCIRAVIDTETINLYSPEDLVEAAKILENYVLRK